MKLLETLDALHAAATPGERRFVKRVQVRPGSRKYHLDAAEDEAVLFSSANGGIVVRTEGGGIFPAADDRWATTLHNAYPTLARVIRAGEVLQLAARRVQEVRERRIADGRALSEGRITRDEWMSRSRPWHIDTSAADASLDTALAAYDAATRAVEGKK